VICGALVCDKCSSCDLIVYVPDEDDAMEKVSCNAVAKLAIIRIVGVCTGDTFCFLFNTKFLILLFACFMKQT